MLSFLMFLMKQMFLQAVYIFYSIKIKWKDSIEWLRDLIIYLCLTLNRTSIFYRFLQWHSPAKLVYKPYFGEA